MTSERKILKDGQFEFLGGVDSGRNPILIAPNQVSLAGNVTFRGGFCDQRPGFSQVGLTFTRDEYFQWWKTAKLQGVGVYDLIDQVQILVALSGRIFAIDLADYSVYERTPRGDIHSRFSATIPAIGSSFTLTVDSAGDIVEGHPIYIGEFEYTVTSRGSTTLTLTNVDDTGAGDTLPGGTKLNYLNSNLSYGQHAWFEQADQYMIVQDGVNEAIIIDGPKARRAKKENNEVPTGTCMAYGNGRLWVATSAQEYCAGDIVGGGTEVYKFTENTYLAEGGKFKIPSISGKIKGMKFLPVLDTSLGQGPLLIYTDRCIFSCNAPTDRDVWKNMTNPIQTYVSIGYGAESHYSITSVNGDSWYRSKDGWRSFIQATRDFMSWGNVPASEELSYLIKNDDPKLLEFSSSILFDNRLLMTVNPKPDGSGCHHAGLAALDFSPISRLGAKGTPAFDMLWTGIKPTMLTKAVYSGEEKAFAFAVNTDGWNELWEISRNEKFDNTEGRIKSFVETRGYSFRGPYELKKLNRLELFLDEVQGIVDFTVYYRPDGYPCWLSWHDFQVCQEYRTCESDLTGCNTLQVKQPGFRTRIILPEPDDVDLETDNKPSRNFYTVQFRPHRPR